MLTNRNTSYIITLASGGNDRKQRKNRKQTAVGEKYSRGRRGAPAKGVGRETGARVQIPLSPLNLIEKLEKENRKKLKKVVDKRKKL